MYLLNTPDTQNYGQVSGKACMDKSEFQSMKPVKYYTTTFSDLDPNNLTSLTRGIHFNDGFGMPLDSVTTSSSLRNGKFSEKPCDGLGPTPLPTTAGFYRGHGDIDIENGLRPLYSETSSSCKPKGTEMFNRTMSIFTNDIPSPYANIDDYFIPNNIQYGANSRGNSVKKYSRKYSSTPRESCI